MKKEDFEIDLEEKCLDSVRACKEYEYENAANRAAFLSGYFREKYPELSNVFDFIIYGKHIDLDDIPF